MNHELYPHQLLAIQRVRDSLRTGHRRPMLMAPTGFGKTLVGASIIYNALERDKRVIFTVPRLNLIDQTLEKFWAEGIKDIGVIQGQHELTDWSKPIQLASIQTLMNRSIPNADFAMVDEGHKWFKFYAKWFSDPEWANKAIIGLSATPFTRGLGLHYDDFIIASTTKELIEAGYLSKFRVFAPSHPDMDGVRTTNTADGPDYNEQDLGKSMAKSSNHKALVADVVATWLEKANWQPTFCFAINRAHAQDLRDKFESASVPTGYIDCYTDSEERDAVMRQFRDGRIRVITSVDCLSIGTDEDVRCISMARPTKSEIWFVQAVGRGLRPARGKDHLLILDHSDNHLRLGFVTDINHDRLDCNEPRKAAVAQPGEKPLPKECPQCAYVVPVGIYECPNCGYKRKLVTTVAYQDGRLVEMESRKAMVLNKQETWDEKRSFMAQLKGYARLKGHREGWAAYKYKEKYGVWPNDPRVRYVMPVEPTNEVWSWCKAQEIRWAKRKLLGPPKSKDERWQEIRDKVVKDAYQDASLTGKKATGSG
jgi:DNA repair protein RadD